MDLEKFFNEISPTEKKRSPFFSLLNNIYFILLPMNMKNIIKKNYIIVLYHTVILKL